MKKHLLKEKKGELTSLPAKTTKVRPKVPCDCKKCNSKFVDTRTRQKHEIEENRLLESISNRSNRKKDKEKDLESTTDDPSDSNSVSDEDVSSNSWILLWIFKYQERFKLSDVAIDSLIGFFSLVLKDVNLNRFKKFPSTAYMARRLLEIKKKSKTFAACPDCNKLYDTATIIATNTNNENSGFKCTYVEFPNHPMQSQRQSCGSELLMKVPVNNGYIWRPKMVYPLPCLKTQVSTMYQRPGFEELLNK